MRCVALLGVLLAAAPSCTRVHRANPAATIEEPPAPASFIQVATPEAAPQLLGGFHSVERGAWRWTERRFSVKLSPPLILARGVRLDLKFTLPDVVAAKMLGVSVTPTVAGTKLPPCRVEKAGDQTCSFDVPAGLLQSEVAVVQFDLDKAVEPNSGDSRQLGLVVSAVGFSAK